MDVTTLLNISLGVIATVSTVVATYLAWREHRRPDPGEAITVGGKVAIYLTRKSTVDAFAEMIDRAPAGSLVFGQCKACTDYPDAFYQAILRESARGVRFQFLVNPGIEGREFAESIAAVGTMEVKFKHIEFARLLGIKDRESISVVPSPNGYIGLHLRDPFAAKQGYKMFESEWAVGSSG